MEKWLGIVVALMTVIPWAIAYKRKCTNLILIDLVSFFFSWTIVGWVVRMAWTMYWKSDPPTCEGVGRQRTAAEEKGNES
jgi:hypothetical protein